MESITIVTIVMDTRALWKRFTLYRPYAVFLLKTLTNLKRSLDRNVTNDDNDDGGVIVLSVMLILVVVVVMVVMMMTMMYNYDNKTIMIMKWSRMIWIA